MLCGKVTSGRWSILGQLSGALSLGGTLDVDSVRFDLPIAKSLLTVVLFGQALVEIVGKRSKTLAIVGSSVWVGDKCQPREAGDVLKIPFRSDRRQGAITHLCCSIVPIPREEARRLATGPSENLSFFDYHNVEVSTSEFF